MSPQIWPLSHHLILTITCYFSSFRSDPQTAWQTVLFLCGDVTYCCLINTELMANHSRGSSSNRYFLHQAYSSPPVFRTQDSTSMLGLGATLIGTISNNKHKGAENEALDGPQKGHLFPVWDQFGQDMHLSWCSGHIPEWPQRCLECGFGGYKYILVNRIMHKLIFREKREWTLSSVLLGMAGGLHPAGPYPPRPQHGGLPNMVAGHGRTNYVVTAWLRASPKRWRRKLQGLSWPSFGSRTESLPPHSVGCEGAQIQVGEVWTLHLVRVMLWRSSLENTIWTAGGIKRTKQSSSYYLIGSNYNKRCFNQTPTDVDVITQKACFRLPQETQAASPTLSPATSSRER